MFVRRPILDRRPVQNLLVVGALAISVVMLTPPFSPVLGDAETLKALRSARPWQALRIVPGLRHRESGPAPATFGTVPLTPQSGVKRAPVQVKGILVNGYSAGSSRLDDLLSLVKRTELNAVVVDVKDERGELSWLPRTPMAGVAAAGLNKILDPKAMVRRLHKEGVYAIGRVVAFRDAKLAQVRPDLALADIRGGVWHDDTGLAWTDPYSSEVQDYNIAVAVEAVEAGFDEIQFDYAQFPSDGNNTAQWSRFADGRSRAVVIRDFLARARREISARGRYTSVDMFADNALVYDRPELGQDFRMMATAVDYVCPMVWPAILPKPSFGFLDPERVPGPTIYAVVTDALHRIAGTGAHLRPWLQDFSLRVPYTPVEVSGQITADERAGTKEWLLWNALNRYSEDALRPSPEQRQPPPLPGQSGASR